MGRSSCATASAGPGPGPIGHVAANDFVRLVCLEGPASTPLPAAWGAQSGFRRHPGRGPSGAGLRLPRLIRVPHADGRRQPSTSSFQGACGGRDAPPPCVDPHEQRRQDEKSAMSASAITTQ